MKKTKETKKNEGITLIALVITIIVLLILAAVSIATLTGDNGILTQVKKAKSEWEGARKEEEDRLSLYEDKIEDSISEGIWRISLSTNELSTTVKIKVRSEFYSVIPDTLKEYKEWYILKGMSDVDPECKSLDEYCTSALGVSSMEEVIKYFEEQTGNTYTRDEIIYDQLLHSENEDEALKTMGYSTEDIEKIEKEYERMKNTKIPDRYLNKTFTLKYPDEKEENVMGTDLSTYDGEYSVNENNKDYQIKIIENGEEKVVSINVKNFVKYLTYEDEYYNYEFDEYNKVYKVSVKDKTLSKYGDVLENIDGIPIVSLEDTFSQCKNLVEAPKIPENIKILRSTFSQCTNLAQAPEIPDGVTDMSYAFSACGKITQAPEIPASVTRMYGTFRYTGLVKAPVIPENVIDISHIYVHCKQLIEVPDIPKGVRDMSYAFWECTNLEKAPKIQEGTENVRSAFADCTNLIQAPEIPSSAKYINNVFGNCPKLTGTIKINSLQLGVERGFTDNPGSKSLSGTGTQGSGLKIVVPNEEVRNLLIANSGYDASKVEIVASE